MLCTGGGTAAAQSWSLIPKLPLRMLLVPGPQESPFLPSSTGKDLQSEVVLATDLTGSGHVAGDSRDPSFWFSLIIVLVNAM